VLFSQFILRIKKELYIEKGKKNPDALPNAGVREAIEPPAMGNGKWVHYCEQSRSIKGSFKYYVDNIIK
jgi:hypothetical protein